MFGDYLGTLALALLYLLAMFGWGSLLLVPFHAKPRSFWNDFSARLVAGGGVLYACYVGLSSAGLLHRFEVGVVLGIGVLAACGFVIDFIKTASL